MLEDARNYIVKQAEENSSLRSNFLDLNKANLHLHIIKRKLELELGELKSGVPNLEIAAVKTELQRLQNENKDLQELNKKLRNNAEIMTRTNLAVGQIALKAQMAAKDTQAKYQQLLSSDLKKENETLRATRNELVAEVNRMAEAIERGETIIAKAEQNLGQALGLPWFCADQKNFPGSTPADGVILGPNDDLETLAARAADVINETRRLLTFHALDGFTGAAGNFVARCKRLLAKIGVTE